MTTLIKISQLPSATTPLEGNEVMTIIQGGVSKKISASAINDLITSPVTTAQAAAESAAAAAAASATSANTSATLAATQVSSAGTYATNAATSATNSAASATLAQDWATKTSAEVVTGQGYGAKKYAQDAAASATSMSSSVSAAAASATAAATSEANALTSKNAAATSASTASTKATEAAASATSAATSASTATTKASDAAGSATSASTSASSATASATTATTKAGEAATSATNAATSATNAATSETNALSYKNSASTSATTATTQAGIATTKAGEAATSATNAAASASAASTSETNALSYKNAAATSASTATTQAGIATTQATTATTQAGIATTKAGEAASSATAASSAQAAAESARDSTLAAFDSFDDRYLGPKASDPTVDNDGNTLLAGALYYCTATGSEGMKVYTGTAWVAAYVSGGGALIAANNLSDLASASTARTNLGLATVAATGSYTDLSNKPTIPTVPTTVSSFTNDAGYLTSYTETDPVFVASPAYGITSTNVTNWNTAYGWGNHASAGYLTTSSAATTYQPLDADLTAIGGLTGASGLLKKTAANTWSLDTTTYLDTTTAASTYQTQSGMSSYLTTSAASTNYQPKDADLTAIAGLAGTSGLLKKTAADTWALDTSTYLTGITSSQVTTALGYTPYNATNPNGYTSNTGTVTSVGGTGSVSGLSLSGSVTTSGNLTLSGTLSVTPSNFASQTANTVLAAPNGVAGTPAFRALVAADIPTLNQNTTGTAANVTGTVAIANGGTGATTAGAALTSLGAQSALVSGTNIKTINGSTLLGSGDLAVSGMVYPGAGIAVSTGSAWGTSLVDPAGDLVGTTETQTLTNKRITPRVVTTTSTATPSINTDTTDIYGLTALAVAITGVTVTGTPTDGQKLWVYIVGTAARAITWGTSFEASTCALPTTTVTTNRLDVGFVWNAATSKWRCVAVA